MAAPLSQENRAVRIIKLLSFLIFLPVFVGFIGGFCLVLDKLEPLFSQCFYWGVIAYLVVHIFIFEPLQFYKKTQKFIQVIFGFFAPLFKVAHYIVPLWVIILILVYLILKFAFQINVIQEIFFFLTGAFFMMHTALVAKMLRTDDLHKIIDYFFLILLVLMINVFFLALTIKVYQPQFSLTAIAQEGFQWGIGVCRTVFNQLFVPS